MLIYICSPLNAGQAGNSELGTGQLSNIFSNLRSLKYLKAIYVMLEETAFISKNGLSDQVHI